MQEDLVVYVENEQSNHFKINPQAIAFLNSIEGPVAIIGIAGMYRTGKSYLLNQVI